MNDKIELYKISKDKYEGIKLLLEEYNKVLSLQDKSSIIPSDKKYSKDDQVYKELTKLANRRLIMTDFENLRKDSIEPVTKSHENGSDALTKSTNESAITQKRNHEFNQRSLNVNIEDFGKYSETHGDILNGEGDIHNELKIIANDARILEESFSESINAKKTALNSNLGSL